MFLGYYVEDTSTFVSMLGFFEQQPLYNAMNFSRTITSGTNSTVYAAGLADALVPERRPDHRQAIQLRPLRRLGRRPDNPNLTVAYTSYGCCFGTWHPEILNYCGVMAPAPMNSCPSFTRDQQHASTGRSACATPSRSRRSPTARATPSCTPSEPTGSSLQRTALCYDWWGDCVSADTIFTTLYPINAYKKIPHGHRGI